jgi:hypothetical protein
VVQCVIFQMTVCRGKSEWVEEELDKTQTWKSHAYIICIDFPQCIFNTYVHMDSLYTANSNLMRAAASHHILPLSLSLSFSFSLSLSLSLSFSLSPSRYIECNPEATMLASTLSLARSKTTLFCIICMSPSLLVFMNEISIIGALRANITWTYMS